MTSPTVAGIDLMELAGRVEAASGPDRRLDAAICRWRDLPVCREPDCLPDVLVRILDHVDGGGDDPEVPAYTASLDAAMTLVPEGMWAEGSLGSHVDQRASLEIHAPCTYDPIGRATAASPALALTSAALRARASLIEEERS